MRRHIHRIDTSRELLLQPWAGGYMLLKPNHAIPEEAEKSNLKPSLKSLGDMLDQTFDVYLYNSNHCFQTVNEEFVKSGYLSVKSVYGKHATEVFPVEGETLVRNNLDVLNTRRSRIIQEDILMPTGLTQEYLSVKAPLYNDKGDLVGVFGTSMLLGTHSLAASLQQVVQLGMLNPARFPDHATQQLNARYQLFSRRERECLYYLSRAKTAKEISQILNVSARTIEHYIDNIKVKTEISTRTELIAYAINLFS